MEATIVNLISADGVHFSVKKDVALLSNTIKYLLEDLAEESAPIPLPNVTGAILDKVIQFCEYHTLHSELDVNQYYKSGTISDEWDIEFCKIPMAFKIDLINSANYLDIKCLVDTLVVSIANMIKGKSVEEIKEIMNIPEESQVSQPPQANESQVSQAPQKE